MSDAVLLAIVIVTTSGLTVAGVLLVYLGVWGKRAPVSRTGATPDPTFLLDKDAVVDANPAGRSLLGTLRAGDMAGRSDRALLVDHVDRLVPGASMALLALQEGEDLVRTYAGIELRGRQIGGLTRLSLLDLSAEARDIALDRLSYRALNDELELLRGLAEHAPLPIWAEGEDGRVTWANSAYLQLILRLYPDKPLSWPMPALFAPTAPGEVTRVSLATGAAQRSVEWFDVHRAMTRQGLFSFAIFANAAQQAEASKRHFVQTLTKTFSTLPIGLAVFDSSRRMQIFNPALTDLTGLEPEFLLSRPRIEGFLNRLRERHVMPEPRDYALWMKTLLSIDSGRHDFEETWTLPGGRTLRFRASPHPDGALAFMIEDISSEVILSAQQRLVVETGQAVLDTLQDAVAVFSPAGKLLVTNDAFGDLWALDDEGGIDSVTLADALATWADESQDRRLWRKIAELATTRAQGPDVVQGFMALGSGEAFRVIAQQSKTGALVIRFSPTTQNDTEGDDAIGRALHLATG